MSLYVKLGKTDILTVLSLAIHEHEIFFGFFHLIAFLIWFLDFLRFMPKYFTFKDANINVIMFLMSNSACSLMVYRKETDFCILTLYLATWL